MLPDVSGRHPKAFGKLRGASGKRDAAPRVHTNTNPAGVWGSICRSLEPRRTGVGVYPGVPQGSGRPPETSGTFTFFAGELPLKAG